MSAHRYCYSTLVLSPYDWFVVVRDTETGRGRVFHNDNAGVKQYIDEHEGLYGAFGGKGYHSFIIKGVYRTPPMNTQQIYELHNHLSYGNPGWRFPLFRNDNWNINGTDLASDTSGFSIESIAGFMGKPIPVLPVSNYANRALTPEETRDVSFYLRDYSETVQDLMLIRKPYLDAKETLSNEYHVAGLNETNAGLCALIFNARKPKQERTDARDYVIPDNVLTQYIPEELMNLIRAIREPSYTDEQVFSNSATFTIGGTVVKSGNGGIHGAIPNYDSANLPDGRVNIYLDVISFYSSIIINNRYFSRNTANPSSYEVIVNNRKEAKHRGLTDIANSLKTVINTYYGALLNPYNGLYDKLMGKSVVFSGQLYLTELLSHLATDIPGLKLVQANTDGFIIECDKAQTDDVMSIVHEWENRTGLILEQDTDIARFIQKNVNNYIEVNKNGDIKVRGDDLNKGIEQRASFKCNTNAVIISDAVLEYVLNGTPIEKTISECTDIHKFQYIVKSNNELYQLDGGEFTPVGNVCRVYASREQERSTIFSKANNNLRKVGGIPEHCVTDNQNKLSVKDININHYITEACKMAEGYLNREVKPVMVAYDKFSDIDVGELELDMSFDDLLEQEEKIEEQAQTDKTRAVMPTEDALAELKEGFDNGFIDIKDYNERLSDIMPKFSSEVIRAYRGTVIPDNISKELCHIYVSHLPTWVNDKVLHNGTTSDIFDRDGIVIANGCTGIIVNEYGVFAELGELKTENLASDGIEVNGAVISKSTGTIPCTIRTMTVDAPPFVKDHSYVSVYEVMDHDLFQDMFPFPFEIKDEVTPVNESEDIVSSLKSSYFIYRSENDDGIPSVYNCHIYTNPESCYLNIISVAESDLMGFYKEAQGNINKIEELMFVRGDHLDIPVDDYRFKPVINHLLEIKDANPESMVDFKDVSECLKGTIKDIARDGMVYGVL